MNDEPNQEPQSFAEILYALIPALVLFLESILTKPGQPQTPALRRMARILDELRELSALCSEGIAPDPIQIEAPGPHVRASRGRLLRHTRALSPAARSTGFTPEPWRTLEL